MAVTPFDRAVQACAEMPDSEGRRRWHRAAKAPAGRVETRPEPDAVRRDPPTPRPVPEPPAPAVEALLEMRDEPVVDTRAVPVPDRSSRPCPRRSG